MPPTADLSVLIDPGGDDGLLNFGMPQQGGFRFRTSLDAVNRGNWFNLIVQYEPNG